jgi:hypothetical protein
VWTKYSQMLAAFFVFFLLIPSAFSKTSVEKLAHSFNWFSVGSLSIIYTFSLVTGVILLMAGIKRFKKYSESQSNSSFTIALMYCVFGVGFIILYLLYK